jgi:hypothetical protein
LQCVAITELFLCVVCPSVVVILWHAYSMAQCYAWLILACSSVLSSQANVKVIC